MKCVGKKGEKKEKRRAPKKKKEEKKGLVKLLPKLKENGKEKDVTIAFISPTDTKRKAKQRGQQVP